MKKLGFFIETTFVCLIMTMACVGCYAVDHKKVKSMYTSIDSTMRAEIGDSIASIIMDANRVIAERTNISGDSIKVISAKKLKPTEVSVAKFLFAANENYGYTATIFGRLSPNIRLIFIKKKATCTAYFDFGQKLMIIKNGEDKEIKRSILKDRQFLKLANIFFQNDEFLTFLMNNQ